MKLKVSITIAVFALLAAGAGLSEAPKLHPAGGLVFVDPYTVPGYKVLDESTILPNPGPALESSVDLSSEMPPVGDQGIQNSCVGWAAGYYDKTHAEYLDTAEDQCR